MKSIIPLIASIALAGCAVGPDYVQPSLPTEANFTLSGNNAFKDGSSKTIDGQAVVSGQNLPAAWWTLFQSSLLDSYIKQALAHNPDLEAATATLQAAQENVYAAGGALLPQVDAGLSSTRQKTSSASFGTGIPSSIYTLHSASVSVSYDLDLWGRNLRQLESVAAQRDYERFQLAAAYVSLTTNIVNSAVQEASLKAQIDATQRILDVQRQQLKLFDAQLDAGAVARSDVLAQQTRLAQTEATLPGLEKQLSQNRNQLLALMGAFPNADDAQRFALDKLVLPVEIPLSLPSQLVGQRPDIQAAAATLQQASANIGVATANMLPQITLSATAGSSALALGDLFTAGTGIWSLGADLAQPIFEGGTLLHRKRSAEATYAATLAQYRSTVLSAFKDVANALDALQHDAQTLAAQTRAAKIASENLDIARVQYQSGSTTITFLLDAQRSYEETQISVAQAQASRFSDTAALFQALGGGWWHKPDQTKPADKTSELKQGPIS